MAERSRSPDSSSGVSDQQSQAFRLGLKRAFLKQESCESFWLLLAEKTLTNCHSVFTRTSKLSTFSDTWQTERVLTTSLAAAFVNGHQPLEIWEMIQARIVSQVWTLSGENLIQHPLKRILSQNSLSTAAVLLSPSKYYGHYVLQCLPIYVHGCVWPSL